MKRITFVRLRPAETVNEISVTTRRREGTTTLEMAAPDQAAISVERPPSAR